MPKSRMLWFRFYVEALEDPKVQSLPDKLFKTWVNLLCLTSRHDGRLPPLNDVAFGLRITAAEAEKRVGLLTAAGLIDVATDGAGSPILRPHNWDDRQFKSDTCNDRVARYRSRMKATGLSRGQGGGRPALTVVSTEPI